jgi:alpha-beta hydrolase superfamily lysophospholipase
MSSQSRRIGLLAIALVGAYFAVPALLLRYGLDLFLLKPTSSGATHEDDRVEIPLEGGRSVIVRRYGTEASAGCAVFFPGQHGGISGYETHLIPMLRAADATVYAISYPGFDGARGRSTRATLFSDVDRALDVIGNDIQCHHRTVFVGRSLGASVALFSAPRHKPNALILEGVAPTLNSAIQAAMRQSVFTRAWTMLPIHWLVGEDYSLAPLIKTLNPTPIVVMQGNDDTVTPFADLQSLSGFKNVDVVTVDGATHSDAYLIGQSVFAQKLAAFLKSGVDLR